MDLGGGEFCSDPHSLPVPAIQRSSEDLLTLTELIDRHGVDIIYSIIDGKPELAGGLVFIDTAAFFLRQPQTTKT